MNRVLTFLLLVIACMGLLVLTVGIWACGVIMIIEHGGNWAFWTVIGVGTGTILSAFTALKMFRPEMLNR